MQRDDRLRNRAELGIRTEHIYVHVSVVCQINCVGGITYGPRACSKSFFLAVKNVTPVLFISYKLEL